MKNKVLWLFMVALACSLAFAQLPQQVADTPLPHDPEILMGTLENGINYYIMQNSRPANRAELRLYVDAGSILEDEDQLGLAHFTEHMAFNGTTHFGRSEVVDYLASIGMGFANGLNAMTSYDFTMYQLKIPTDNQEQLEKGFLILSDMANKVSFHPDELESERGVIIEEWRMGQNAQSRIGNAVSKVRFAGSRYATRQPIGTYETLTTFERDKIVRFYEDWYRPDLQSVVVIGDLEVEAARALVERYFGDIPPKKDPRPREVFQVPNHPAARAVVATDPEYPYSTITASWHREATTYQSIGDFYRDLHEKLFFNMLNARFEELIQEEDPPFSVAYGYSGSMLKGVNSTELTAYTGEGKNREALRSLLTEAERVRQHGFVASELDRAKLRLIRGLEKAMESSSTRESGQIVWGIFASLINDSAIMSAEQNLMLASQMIQNINLEAVNSVIDELITPENLTISYTATAKEGAIHPTEEQLLAVYGEVQALEIQPYEDNEVTEPLMAEIPQPGQIVKSKLHPKSGIKEWTLSNGVKVYSKKTDFKADEILFSAKSPGGYSRYDTARFHAAQSLGSYTASSGLGAFDSNDLSRVLAGKIASVDLDVTVHYEGMNGSASPRDLEVMFQLIHQNATNARFDQKSLTSFVNRYKPFLENAMNSPERVFFDTLSTLTYNNHEMKIPLRAQHLEELQLQQLQSVYSDRYADFSDFSFFFVGNFEEKQLEEYVKTYLATLPVTKRKDKIHDAGIVPFQGKKEVRFRRGSSESAYVSHVTTGKMKTNYDNRAEMSVMLLVLNEKLRENIREQMSGVYMIQAMPKLERLPYQHYTLNILMTCDPERVDELSAAIFATVDSVRTGQFEERYVTSGKAVMQKSHEEFISQNRYWLSNVVNDTLNKDKLASFMENPSRYARIDKKAVTKAAKKYLRFDEDSLTVIMTPMEN